VISSPSRSSNDSIVAWLLDPSEPGIRYLASRDLARPKPGAAQLARLRAEVTERGAGARLLAGYPKGWWGARGGYQPKYSAAVWKLQALADLGASGQDARIAEACERFLELHVAKDGGFLPWPGYANAGHHCLTGNMARSLLRFGYSTKDERVANALDWIVRTQAPDGGWSCWTTKQGTLDSWEGLSALAEVEPRRRTRAMRDAIDRGAEFYLERRLLHEGAPHAPWSWFRYPNHYYYHALVGLDVLTKLGCGKDARLDEAFALARSKRLPDGRWPMDKPLRDHVLEPKGEPSRMVTLVAARAFRRAGRSL
jgi:hypothetical protein